MIKDGLQGPAELFRNATVTDSRIAGDKSGVGKMKVVVITPENPFDGETEQIKRVIGCGVFRLHLRHPKADEQTLRGIIEGLTAEERKKIVLHDCYNLVDEYNLGGAHLNGRHINVDVNVNLDDDTHVRESFFCSRSCHSLEEVATSKNLRYCFLSPIFDSISKVGYASNFTPEFLMQAKADRIINENVIALGGITVDKLDLVREYGFGGVAILGSAWKEGIAQIEIIKQMMA